MSCGTLKTCYVHLVVSSSCLNNVEQENLTVVLIYLFGVLLDDRQNKFLVHGECICMS